MFLGIIEAAKHLKTGMNFWGRGGLSNAVVGEDVSDPRALADGIQNVAQGQAILENVRGEFRRPVYMRDDPSSLIHGRRHVRHRDYTHRIHLPSLRIVDDYRMHPFVTGKTKSDMETPMRHFYRFGLMVDFKEDINLTKHIQARRFKNLIEVIVDGGKVRERELFVLAHFFARREGKLYAGRGKKLILLMNIESDTNDSSVARKMLAEQTHHKVQHYVYRPKHHTQGHPIGGALSRCSLYKRHLGGKLTLDGVGDGLRKVGRTTGRIMTVGGAAALAATPIVAVAAPAAVPLYAAIAGSVGASGLILHRGLAKHPDLNTLSL